MEQINDSLMPEVINTITQDIGDNRNSADSFYGDIFSPELALNRRPSEFLKMSFSIEELTKGPGISTDYPMLYSQSLDLGHSGAGY